MICLEKLDVQGRSLARLTKNESERRLLVVYKDLLLVKSRTQRREVFNKHSPHDLNDDDDSKRRMSTNPSSHQTRPSRVSPPGSRSPVNMELRFTLARHSEPVTAAVFLPYDRLASCSGDETIKIWSLRSGRLEFGIKGHRDAVTCLALLPNGYLASGSADLSVRVWELRSKRLVKTLKGHKSMVLSLQLIPTTGHLASCSSDGAIKLWDLTTVGRAKSHLITLSPHSVKPICSPLGVLANGNLVSCSFHLRNGLLKVWNLYHDRRKLVSQMSTWQSRVSRLVVLPNDLVALGSLDGMIQLVDVAKRSIIASLTLDGFTEPVWSLAALPNGSLLAGYSDEDTAMRVWNPWRGKLLQTVESGHANRITGIHASPNGKLLATVSTDCTIKIWTLS